jgi:hypothetical protein
MANVGSPEWLWEKWWRENKETIQKDWVEHGAVYASIKHTIKKGYLAGYQEGKSHGYSTGFNDGGNKPWGF